MDSQRRNVMNRRLVVLAAVALCLLAAPVECRRRSSRKTHVPSPSPTAPATSPTAPATSPTPRPGLSAPISSSFTYLAPTCRAHSASITDFGGVGDGETLNTNAFRDAVAHLSQYANDGGSQLFIPPGRWLTGSFNLTSAFTLYLHRDAVILGSQLIEEGQEFHTQEHLSGKIDFNEWPLIDPLPSYGRGRDEPGGRYSSLIFGTNLTDVVITGDNGTIDGQGELWWSKFRGNQLKYTRGYLIEVMHSDGVVISNLTLLNSPSWNIHPVYSRNVIVRGITILAPVRSPNTDGINPDSCSHVRIEDCYIVSGDDCVAIKSGWDEYGISFGMPSEHIYIRRLTCISPTSAVIAVGSEMSGGIQEVHAEDITAIDTESAVRIKTAPGRGGFIKGIYVRGVTMQTMKWVFRMTGAYGSHPDGKYDPNAIPVVDGVSYSNMVADNVSIAGAMDGIENAPFTGICMSNITINMAKNWSPKHPAWSCTNIQGTSNGVEPPPCELLSGEQSGKNELGPCPFPDVSDPIDYVEFKDCSFSSTHL